MHGHTYIKFPGKKFLNFHCPTVCLFVCLSVRPSVRPSVRLSFCLSARLSVCLSVCIKQIKILWIHLHEIWYGVISRYIFYLRLCLFRSYNYNTLILRIYTYYFANINVPIITMEESKILDRFILNWKRKLLSALKPKIIKTYLRIFTFHCHYCHDI